VLDEMLKLLDGGFKADPEVADWWKQIEEWRGRVLRYRRSSTSCRST
jgi:acetolactate synthase-1/2/3 large subunit